LIASGGGQESELGRYVGVVVVGALQETKWLGDEG